MQPLLTSSEAAARIGRSRQTVWKYTKQGRLPSKTIGGLAYYAAADVDAWIAAHPESANPNGGSGLRAVR